MERAKISEDEARILVRKTDRMRRSYYNYYTDLRWGGRDQFDLLMDSSVLGIEGTAEMLKAAYQQLVKIPESEMMNRFSEEPFTK
jgi:cytidylate kinase